MLFWMCSVFFIEVFSELGHTKRFIVSHASSSNTFAHFLHATYVQLLKFNPLIRSHFASTKAGCTTWFY